MADPRVLPLTVFACFLTSLLLCELVRRFALRTALLDAPNARSLHARPTPRLGGVAIVTVTVGASACGWKSASPDLHALVAACSVIALVGLRDDVRPLSAGTRIAIQVAISIAFLWCVGIPPLLLFPNAALPIPPVVVGVLLVIWMVGVLNIYNFMDGMDGLAAFQTISASTAIAAMMTSGGVSAFAIALGAAASGFFVHNFPPARIFMGDAGSTFIGFAFAATAVLGMHHGLPITGTALPLAPFLLDGTFTIFRRALKRERIWEAHRSHLYQRAVQAGLSHREVLLVYVAWLGVAAAAAIASSTPTLLVTGWVTVLLGLGVVWRWVVRLESDRANLA